MKHIVKELLQKEQYQQRTKEWYEKRYDIITASNIGSILDANPYLSKADLLKEKCNKISYDNTTSTNDATSWGIRYEPVAIKVYKKFTGEDVNEVGLFIHDKYPWLGASPDGLCNSGKLVEIKCPYRRKINNTPPLYYWIQVQIQLEVCGIEECDLFQCKITEYKNRTEYWKDKMVGEKGVLKYGGKNYYWKLEDYSMTTIKRDSSWFCSVLDNLKNFWDDVIYYRRVGVDKLRTQSHSSSIINRKRSASNRNTLLKRRKEYIGEDWTKWINSKDVYNYVMRDPLLDWLDMYGREKYIVDGDNLFNEHVRRRDIEFRESVILNLYNRFGDRKIIKIACVEERYSVNKYLETINAMKKGFPIILGGVLHNSNNKTYSMPNIILKRRYLSKIIDNYEDEIDINCRSKIGYDYCLVNIKYVSLTLRGRNIVNTGNILSYKSDLVVGNNALGIILGYVPNSMYIIGRKYKENGIYSTFQKIGVVDTNGYDNNVPTKTYEAISWLKQLREKGKKWNPDNPDRWEMYPNMSNGFDSPWKTAKRGIADKLGEITLLWNCGTKEREIAHKKGIYDWRDVDSNIMGFNGHKSDILENILEVNRDDSMVMLNNSCQRIVKDGLIFYVDFETVNDLDVNFDSIINYNVGDDIKTNINGMIYLIGLGWEEKGKWRFKNFIVDRLDHNCEKKILEGWIDSMNNIRLSMGVEDDNVYHWGNAEVVEANKAFSRHNMSGISLNWRDLNGYFKKNCIAIRGVFNYGLKSVASSLYKHKKINTRWPDTTLDGAAAMLVAWNCERRCLDGNKDRLVDSEEMLDIIKYNEIDCKVMWDIMRLL